MKSFLGHGISLDRAGQAPPWPGSAGTSGDTAVQKDELRELGGTAAGGRGERTPQIARRLGLSTHTVERHVANLYRKIGARGRADATAFAFRSGLV